MKREEKKLYEGMYVLDASLSEEALKKAIARITDSIKQHEGEVHKIHNQGRKKLAYPINGHRQGQYCILYFSVIPSAITHMWAEYRLNEDLLRFLTLRAEKVLEKIEFKPLQEV